MQKLAGTRKLMTIAQSRVGRRPIRASKLLEKDKSGTLFKGSGGLLKSASDLPWYTAAAGGSSGSLMVPKLLPKRLSTLGTIGGAVLGTGAGLAAARKIETLKGAPKRDQSIKTGSTAPVHYTSGPSPKDTGLPAKPKRRPGEVPTRDAVDTTPGVEERQGHRAMLPAADALPPGPPDSAKYAQVFRAAFLDELQKIADAHGGVAPWPGEFEKFASSKLVDDFVKEAIIGRVLSKFRPAGKPANPFKVGKGFTMGHGLQEGGAMLKGPKSVPGLSPQDMDMVRRIRGTSVAKRVAGEAAIGAGSHVSHTGLARKMLNPLGVPIGGAIEGATRQVGRELQRAGGAVSTGMKGRPTLGGGLRGGAGRFLERNARTAGLAGEIGTLGTMGAALHAPLSGAAALGGKLAPVLGKAGTLGHIGQDVVGSVAQGSVGRAAGRASRVLPLARLRAAA